MKTVFRRWTKLGAGAALATFSSIMVPARAAAMHPVRTPAAEGNGAQAQATMEMQAAEAELEDSIDAKKVKQGDTIRARISNTVKFSDGKELSKGTMLEGQIDQVQPSDHRSDSTVVVTFSKALVKGGEELHIKATLLSMWEPEEGVSGGMGSGAAMPGSQMSQSGMGPKIPSSSNVMSEGRQPIPGVVLHSDIHEKSSATLTGEHRNVDVAKGTRMKFAVVVVPHGVDIQ